MTFVKRLRLLMCLLGTAAAAAAITSSVRGGGNAPAPAKPLDPVQVATSAARTRFSQQPTVTYRAASGETLFAWQLKPTLEAAAPRERDFVVLIDTSASQAGTAMAQARQIAADLAKNARPGDRLDLWTVNINADSATRSLTQGLQPANGEAVAQALTRLANSEYGSGAVDLPAALAKATKSFESRPNRQQVMLFLGDGESAASAKPFGESVRVEWGNALAEKDVAFVAVPLGVKVQAETLHGLASQTGGAVVRLTDTIDQFRAALTAALDTPVLKVTKATFGPQAVELFPGKLPPLRADRATLVLGAMPLPVRGIEVRLEGTVAGKPVALTLSETLAEPSAENYFLASLVDQWKAAKDVPAMLAADRTLAMASEQFRLFRDEYTVQGSWAISADRIDHAEKLFQAALQIDPQSGEAQGGLRVVEKIRGGVLKADTAKIALAKGTALASIQQDPPAGDVPPANPIPPAGSVPPAAPGTLPPAETSLIEQVRNQQAAQEQAFRIAVEETLRRARGLQNTDPDGAYDDLKRQRDIVVTNDQLSEPVRRRLALDLEAAMNDVRLRAGTIKEQQARERERIAQVRQRRTELDLIQTQEEQTRNRVDNFRQLMNQARFEYAQQEAQVMTQERISKGQGVPPAVFASYRIGQAATNIREFSELRRLRENNYLLTMMQVEKSFVPYPDEPPVHFPPAAVWRELTANRQQTYSNTELGPDTPPSLRRLRDVIEGRPGAKRVRVEGTEGLSLDAVLQSLQAYYQDEGIKFVPRGDLFGPDDKPGEKKIKTNLANLNGLPLGAFLDTMLRDLKMSYIVRPEYIEYGPNDNDFSLRYDEKVTRVFDVAELIISIPNAQSTSALIQNLQFAGQQATIFGAALQPFAGAAVNPFGLGGGIGGIGGGLGGFGGGLGGGIGGFGGGALGGGLGGGGAAGFGGQGAAGIGGALGGVVGGQQGQAGQQGQLGQLGSAFSIRGNDQSQALLQLITQTVAPGEWNLRTITGYTQNQLQRDFSEEDRNNTLDPRKLNSVGFYPPARALIVRGSHRYHASPSFNLKFVGGGGAMMQGPGVPREGQFAADPKAGAKEAAVRAINARDKDPEALWNTALAGITRQDAVIDAVDVLSEMKEFGHASAALKAALRQGRANGGWTHEALAIALKQTQASPGEVERASLSAIDLDPTNADCYLKAAKAEAELDQPQVALAFCQRAAALAPNRSEAYADALRYATLASKGGDVKSDAVEWASTNLLSRDWAEPGTHADARARVRGFADQLAKSGQVERANRLKAATEADKARDIVIQLLYQGRADLDLEVLEPTGSLCSSTRARTTNGGVLVGDQLERAADDQTETYTAATAFAGVYKIAVKPVVGTPIGNRARVRVVMHQGTPEETAQVFSVDVSKPAAVSVELKSGRRTELADVPPEVKELRSAGSQAPAPAPPSGFSGGFEANSPEPSVPLAVAATEAKVSGAASNLPGFRLETKLGADRKSVVMKARPVFSGPAKDIARPRTSILPGYGA